MPRENSFRNIYQDIFNQASVREVMESYGLAIEKHGKSYRTICPFHDDSTPSLSIRNDDKVWKCFACNESGNAISFVQKYENKILHNASFTTLDAMQKVVDICHLNIDLTNLQQNTQDVRYTHNRHTYTDREKHLLQVTERLKKIGVYNLMNANDPTVKNYLLGRGFTQELIEDREFGYIPQDTVEKWIREGSVTFDLNDLLDVGFLRLNEQGEYRPVFGNRVLIPIQDEQGNTVTFSGRAVHDETPKYLHGQNTILFQKDNQLYNYSNAKNYAYGNEIYIVEGFMDVAGGNKIGMNNIVATMGTSLSTTQLDMIKRLNCEIVLMRDNDQAGKNAMIKEAPELMKQGFTVSIVDLGKVQERLQLSQDIPSKDLWDIANANGTVQDLQAVKQSGFVFLIENKYFADKDINTETIKQAFDEAKEDGLIPTQTEESIFLDYVEGHSRYPREEIRDVVESRPIVNREDPVVRFQQNLMDRYITSNVQRYVQTKGDKALKAYYGDHEQQISQMALERFNVEPTKYLDETLSRMDFGLLTNDVLSQDEQWLRYAAIHRFRFENAFERTFVKNQNGETRQIYLTEEQKREIVKQYDSSFHETTKLNMSHVEEIYIVNRRDELKTILDVQATDTAGEMILESIEWDFVDTNRMSVFNYGGVFSKDLLPIIDSRYKTPDGKNFKTILLFNNLDGVIELKESNLVKQQSSYERNRDTKERIEKDIDQTRSFSVYKTLIRNETKNSYFVCIPNTKGNSFMYLPKDVCSWSNNKEILMATLDTNTSYPIYNRNREKVTTWSISKLMQYWKERSFKEPEQKSFPKTGNLSKFSKDTSLKEVQEKYIQTKKAPVQEETQKKEKPKLDIPKYQPYKVQNFKGYVIPYGRVKEENESGYMIQAYQPQYDVFVPNKYAYKDRNGNIVVNPEVADNIQSKTKSKMTSIALWKNNSSLEVQHCGFLTYDKLDQYLFEKGKDIFAVFEEEQLEQTEKGNVIVPVYYDKQYCKVLVPRTDLERMEDSQVALMTSPYREYNCYSKDNKFMNKICAKDIHEMYEKSQTGMLDIEHLQEKEVEKA